MEDGASLQRTLTGIAQNVFNLQVRGSATWEVGACVSYASDAQERELCDWSDTLVCIVVDGRCVRRVARVREHGGPSHCALRDCSLAMSESLAEYASNVLHVYDPSMLQVRPLARRREVRLLL